MKNVLVKADNWLGGLQWLMFIFVNTVVVPITIGAAYGLSQEAVVSTMQFSFILGGLACLLQVFVGHRRPIMDGPSGLWWGVILALTSMSAAQGVPLAEVGGSIAVGVIIAGVLTILVGITGFGYYLEKLFNPSVMGTFMFLFGVSLCISFLKGMLGIPSGGGSEATIDVAVGILALIIALVVLILTIKGSKKIAQYSMLIGIVIGWPLFAVLLGSESQLGGEVSTSLELFIFPLGAPAWNIGIIITVVITGILNLSKQYGSIKGTDIMYEDDPSTSKDYRNSFAITGVFSIFSGILGLVPYSPFVSSIGFIQQTKIYERMPFIFGSVMFLIMGIIPQVGYFFTLLPLSIGSAVLFVSYVTLFGSAWDWFKKVSFNTTNVYRSAIPLFTGLVLMALPGSAFVTLPDYLQPLLSNGLLMGTILALLFENVMDWDKVGLEEQVTVNTKNI
ncbi:uracil/xanthine transporter [Ornithinibacillus halophilus]|uniref:Xanthine/uracil permease n=1 Tax=Ornithinibacillus halophilus TaxID=930117 RepID=A0A1M5NL06_9BACI|nr:uracil/xanthine transporter [Ornithinibacillus halophilus]SHG90192.1 Xanthine/uracil permease [Ornithinibacillus halophilus]